MTEGSRDALELHETDEIEVSPETAQGLSTIGRVARDRGVEFEHVIRDERLAEERDLRAKMGG